MTTSRSFNLTDVFNALITIRDRVITDENLTTLKRVIDTMTELMLSLHQGVTQENISTLETEFSSRGLQQQFSLIKEIINHPFIQSLSNKVENVSLQGMIDAITFIQTHIKTTENLVADLRELLESLSCIEVYKTQDNSTESPRSISYKTIPEDLLNLYQDFI